MSAAMMTLMTKLCYDAYEGMVYTEMTAYIIFAARNRRWDHHYED